MSGLEEILRRIGVLETARVENSSSRQICRAEMEGRLGNVEKVVDVIIAGQKSVKEEVRKGTKFRNMMLGGFLLLNFFAIVFGSNISAKFKDSDKKTNEAVQTEILKTLKEIKLKGVTNEH